MAAFDPHPIVTWELTRACDLGCRGCPSSAGPAPGANELTTYEVYKTIDQIAAVEPRELVITGGDPLEREDLVQIIDYARRRGLDPALVLSPTAGLTWEAIARLQSSGLTRVVFSVDGSTPAVHQAVHGVGRTFETTLRAMRWAESAGLRIEVNTLVSRANLDDLPAIAQTIVPFGVTRWNVHFVVPVGDSSRIEAVTPAEAERVFDVLERLRRELALPVRVVEAPQYVRFRLECGLEARLHREPASWPDFAGFDDGSSPRELLGSIRGGAREFVYISHAGDVRPSEFIPHSAGNLRYRFLGAIYRASDLFVALRDTRNLKGNCRACEYRDICGGSRARAWAATGDMFASDPLCAYEPAGRSEANPVPSNREARA